MATIKMICHCGQHYDAKSADLKRGWGFSCGKRCAAIRRDYGRPKARIADGSKLPKKTRHGAKRITPDTRVYNTRTNDDVYDWHDDGDSMYWDSKDY